MKGHRWVVPALASLAAAFAHADGDYASPTNDRVRLSLGIMRLSSTTTVSADSSTGVPGEPIDAESELGLAHRKFEPKFQAMVRVGDRQRLRFDYFELDRSASVILTQPLVFHDAVLPANALAPVSSELSLRTLGVAYGYSFWRSETLEIAATFGINATELAASARVQTQTLHIDESENTAGPFPTFGIDATWVASHRFYFDGRAQYLRVSLDHLDGSLGFYELDALYRLRPNVSFALGYTVVKTSIASTKASESGFFDFDTRGPQFFVRVAF
jgi:hypothetical protein